MISRELVNVLSSFVVDLRQFTFYGVWLDHFQRASLITILQYHFSGTVPFFPAEVGSGELASAIP